MRGDLEILAYNLIQWAGGNLPWKTNNLLGNPLQVQQAKESLMNNIDKHISECFNKKACPAPILTFMKLVTKLKFDERPNYENYRKEFQSGLQSLGKTNSGDLDFKAAASPSTPVSQKKGKRAVAVGSPTPANKSQEDTENISPPKSSLKKRPQLDTPDNPHTPSKRSRANVKATSNQIVPSQSTGAQSTDSPIVVNNYVNSTKPGKNSKTYQLNFELDISFDANVVVNVKRKDRKSPKGPKEKKSVKKEIKTESIPDTESPDEIPATEKSFAVGTAKVLKQGTRTSPRARK